MENETELPEYTDGSNDLRHAYYLWLKIAETMDLAERYDGIKIALEVDPLISPYGMVHVTNHCTTIAREFIGVLKGYVMFHTNHANLFLQNGEPQWKS